MRKPACAWRLAEAPAAALELLRILLSMKRWLSFRNVDFLHVISQHVVQEGEKKILGASV